MSSPSNEASGQLVSLPAMLAMLIGAGGLFVIWKFDFLFDDLPTWQIVLLGVALALLLWGTIRSFSDLPMRAAAAFRLWQASRLTAASRAVLPGDHDRHFLRLAVGPVEHADARVFDDGRALRGQRLDHLFDAETDSRGAGRAGTGDGRGTDDR